MSVRRAAACIFALAVLLRLAVFGATFRGNDTVAYFDDSKIAMNLVSGRGYSIDYAYRNWLFYGVFMKHATLKDPILEGVKPTASKQPAYPLILAGMFAVFGLKNFAAVFVFQALLSSLTAAILFMALSRESVTRGASAGIAAAVYPPFVFHAVTTPESTELVLFLLAAMLLWFSRWNGSMPLRAWAVIGGVGGVLALAEPVTLPFTVLCLLYALHLTVGTKVRSLGVTVAAVALASVVTPWLVRNYVVFDRFPVMKSPVGVIFNWGLERSGRGSWISDERLATLEYDGRHKSEVEEDEAIRRELVALFPSHAREYLTVNVPMNFQHFWWEVARYADDRSLPYLLGRRLPYMLLLALALPSLLGSARRLLTRRTRALVDDRVEVCGLMLMVTFTAVYSIAGAYMSRYRFPAELCLIVFAASTLARAYALGTRRWVPAGRHAVNEL